MTLTSEQKYYWDRFILAVRQGRRVAVDSPGRKNSILAVDDQLRENELRAKSQSSDSEIA